MQEFITDFGEVLKGVDGDGNKLEIPRYAYWNDQNPKGKPQVLEVSNDRAYLIQKYGNVPVAKVYWGMEMLQK